MEMIYVCIHYVIREMQLEDYSAWSVSTWDEAESKAIERWARLHMPEAKLLKVEPY